MISYPRLIGQVSCFQASMISCTFNDCVATVYLTSFISSVIIILLCDACGFLIETPSRFSAPPAHHFAIFIKQT
ncbi:hypothetical protein X975_15970, partial [Stegodyphus mimosarum]